MQGVWFFISEWEPTLCFDELLFKKDPLFEGKKRPLVCVSSLPTHPSIRTSVDDDDTNDDDDDGTNG